MEMIIDFPGGARVDAHFGPYTVATDQPPAGGGEGSAPTPFAVFLASLGTCAGIYVLGRVGNPGAAYLPGKIPSFAGQVGGIVRSQETLRAAARLRDHDQGSGTGLIFL